jgi:hypothetical protein
MEVQDDVVSEFRQAMSLVIDAGKALRAVKEAGESLTSPAFKSANVEWTKAGLSALRIACRALAPELLRRDLPLSWD